MSMSTRYLEVTIKDGSPFAAYDHLRSERGGSRRCRQVDPGLIVDLLEHGSPLGIEITHPGAVTIEGFNALLQELGEAPATQAELAPLHAA